MHYCGLRRPLRLGGTASVYCACPARRSAGRLLISRVAGGPEADWVAGITSFLEARSVEVERAHTGRQAIDLVERGGIDAAILSAWTPRVDGLSLLRIIRSRDAGLPCVVVTTEVSKGTLQQALTLGAYSVVTEPVDLAALTRVTAGMFGKRSEWELD